MNGEMRKIRKKEYPLQLQTITQLPESMDILGKLPDELYKILCVVGSRRYTSYGEKACKKIVGGLSGYPIAIVSGLAIGIDSIAHEAALMADLKTIAFPGSGLSPRVLYPRSRLGLARRIIGKGGCLLSPFEYEQDSKLWTFPVRNRLMAGISHAVLVIEGGHGSGTLLTAGYAAEFGRDVMAVPGSIFEEQSYGPHMLIRDGAAIISSSEDVLRTLGFEAGTSQKKNFLNIAELALRPEEKRIIATLRFAPSQSSSLIETVSLSAAEFNVCMSHLELLGVVVEEQGVYQLRQSL